MAAGSDKAADDDDAFEDSTPTTASAPRRKPFRFKRKTSPHASSDSGPHSRASRRHDGGASHHHRSHRPRSRGRRRDSRSRSPQRSPGLKSPELSPDTAFRESLFDALADDEGAAYWEGVYGQPIHVYPPPAQSGETYEGDQYMNPEVLDAEEYATYVRRKMWEKSHQHIIEERARRQREAEKRKEEEEARARARARYQHEWQHWEKAGSDGRSRFDEMLDEGLARGAQRRDERRWRRAWSDYLDKWGKLVAFRSEGGLVGQASDNVELPWPTLSGEKADVSPTTVREFFRRAPAANRREEPRVQTNRAQLKLERVRWHPDKVMQRLKVSNDTLQLVTAVFQIIDQMWNEEKDREP